MKKVYFRTSEDNYTYIKEKIGFENIDQFFSNCINVDKEHKEMVEYGRNKKQ